VKGCKRFLDRVWNLMERVKPGAAYSPENEASIHKTIKKVSDDIEAMKFNTAIAALMTLVNEFYERGLNRADMQALLLLLAPFAPHMSEELWEQLGCKGLATVAPWPKFDLAKTIDAEVTLAVQVGGKLKGTVLMPLDSSQEAVLAAIAVDEKLSKQLEGMELVKTILVPNKLVNLILKPKA